MPQPVSRYSTPMQTDPLSEIGFGHSPLEEFGQNPFDKKWAKALTDPEADPRFGGGFKKGFQIDQKPFKMKAKAEKRKAKRDRKAAKMKGLKFNEAEEDDENGQVLPVENSIPLH